MIWVRRGTVFVFSVVLFASLLGLVGSINFNRNLGSPQKVEKILAESGFYDQVVAIALDEAQDQRSSAGPTSIPLSDVIVQQAAKQAFTPQLIEANANTIINANYKWLSGEAKTPSFTIDLSNAKQTFADRVGQYVEERLSKLSSCTPEQLAQIQQPVNPLAIPCLPQGVTPQSAAETTVQELLGSNFIDTPVITADTLGREADSQQKPYYEQLSSLPKSYQLAQKMPFIHTAVIIISLLAILFISLTRRKGIRRLAVIFLLAGFILISTSLFTSVVVEAIGKQVNNGVASQLQEPKETALESIVTQFTRINFWSGIVFVVIAAGLITYLLTTRGKSGGTLSDNYQEPAKPGSTVAPTPAQTLNPAARGMKLKSRRSNNTPTDTLRPTSSPATTVARPKTPTGSMTRTPAPKKRPPNPRGPRLIQ